MLHHSRPRVELRLYFLHYIVDPDYLQCTCPIQKPMSRNRIKSSHCFHPCCNTPASTLFHLSPLSLVDADADARRPVHHSPPKAPATRPHPLPPLACRSLAVFTASHRRSVAKKSANALVDRWSPNGQPNDLSRSAFQAAFSPTARRATVPPRLAECPPPPPPAPSPSRRARPSP